MVNFAGITFFHRLSQETSASAEELARAHFVAREVYGANDLVRHICALDNQIDAGVQTDMRLAVRTLIERASRWLVNNRRPPLDSEATVEYFGTDIQKVMHALPDLLTGVQAEEFLARRKGLASQGVPEELATSIAVLPPAYAVLEVVEIAKRDGIDALVVTRIHSVLAERLGLSELTAMIYQLPREDRWQTMARATLRDDLHAVHALLTAQVLRSTDEGASAEERVSSWETDDSVVVSRAKTTLEEITSDSDPDLARMSVGLRVVRTMLTN
jgi:glutamate dehydrogenase